MPLVIELEKGSSLVLDSDGNIYHTVTLGTQVWMVENLKTTKFCDGKVIPLVTSNLDWGNLQSPAYCWYNNDEATYKTNYGALYNWYAINAGNYNQSVVLRFGQPKIFGLSVRCIKNNE